MTVRPEGASAKWWHTGSLPGTIAVLYRSADGHTWAALFNSSPRTTGAGFLVDVIAAMGKAAIIDALRWGSLAVTGVLVGLGVLVAALLWRRQGSTQRREQSSRAFPVVGGSWIIVGSLATVVHFFLGLPLFIPVPIIAMGLIYIGLGLTRGPHRQTSSTAA